jgi:hypothetical protein
MDLSECSPPTREVKVVSSKQTKRPTRIRGFLVILAAATVGVLSPGLFSAVSAQPYGEAPATVSNSNPNPGSAVTFSASGFQPNSNAQVYFESTPVLLETVSADANGTVASTVTIPSDAVPGDHDIVVTGTAPDGSPLSVSIPITVVSATTSGTSGLAFTGADIAIVATVGLLALGFGGFLLLSVRRKRQAIGR